MKKLNIILVLVLLSLLSEMAFASSPFQHYDSGRFDIDLAVDYFKSTANFQSDATKAALPAGYHLQTINFLTEARYVFIQDFGVLLGVAVNSTESRDSLATRTNSTLSHVHFGADYRIVESESWELTAETKYIHAVEKVDVTADSALNSDGAGQIIGSLGTAFRWGGFTPYAKGGINYRMEGLSTLLTYAAGAEWQFEKIAVGGAVIGYMSIKDDEKTTQSTDRETLTNRVNATSKKYYSINPNLTDSEFYLKYRLDESLAFRFFGGYTIIGSNSAEGFHGGAAVTWGFGGSSSQSYESEHHGSGRHKKNSVSVDPSEKGFKEDVNDGVNQDYFKPVTPSKEEYVEEVETSTQNQEVPEPPPPPKTKVKAKPVVNPETVEKEYKVKIKKKKKKK